MSTKITYNGKTTELADGYIATLPCKDLKMETDVVVEAPEGSGVAIAEWNGSIAYNPDAIVIFEKIYYVCIKATSAGSVVNNPSVTPSEWKRLNGAYKGEYNSSTTYYLGDIVLSNNNLYQSKIDNPETTPDNDMASRWTLLHEGGSGGGAELNIAYGDTAPEDTSKLWVKTSKPSKVKVSSKFNYRGSGETFETLSVTMPVILRGNVSAVVGNKIYMLMGNTPSANGNSRIYCFDAETGTATTLSATISTATWEGGGAVVGTRIYTLGGISSGGGNYAVCCFDTDTEVVTTLSITQAYFGGGLWVDGTIIRGYGTQSPSMFAIDTTTNTKVGTSMTFSERKRRTSAKIGKNVYLFGGLTSMNNADATNTIYKANAEATQETLLPVTLPQPASQLASVVMGTLIYLFGGISPSSEYIDTVWCFDTKTETISTCSITTPEAMFGVYAAQSTPMGTYVIGGNKTNDKVWKFTADLKVLLGNGEMQIEPSLTDNTFNLINTDTIKAEIGVNKVYKGNADGIGEEVEAALHNGTSWVTI